MFRIIVILKNVSRPVAVVLLITATFLVYWPALRNGFVWDDTALVLRDPLIRSWRLIPEGFRHFLFLDATASDFYRPLQRLTFTADYALFGFEAPWGWHLTSLAVHAAAAVALFFLVGKLMPERRSLAFAAALVWTMHPIQTSAVAYLAGRADPLAALFGFSALALAIASLDRRRSRALTVAAALCFLAAMLSKESGVVALLIWFLFLAWRRVPWGILGKWLAIATVVSGCYAGFRFTAEKVPPPAPPQTPLAIRPILASRAVAEYAGLLMAPVKLRMERDVSISPRATPEATTRNARLREYQTLLGALLIIGFAFWLRREWRAHSPAAFCLLGCAIAWLPVSNLFSLNATVAEHWFYVPSAFLLTAAACSLDACLTGRVRLVAVSLFTIWLVVLGIRTVLQQSAWHDQRAFLETTIARGGDSARMHINLGNLESSAGHHDAALAHFRTAIARAPGQPMAWLGLANAAIRARDFETARQALDKAPGSPLLAADVLQARAILEHLETGRDTSDLLLEAIAAAPRRWAIHKRYIEHLDERGATAQAARELRDFLAREQFRAESWRLLGQFLEKLAQPAAAAAAYHRATMLDVRDTISRARLAALGAARD